MANTDYAHFFNSFGFKLAGTVGITVISSDPIVSGLDLPEGSLAIRNDVPKLYQKNGAGNMDWTDVTGSGGGAIDITDHFDVIVAGFDNDQTGTAYELVLTDQENTTIWMDNIAINTVTIPLNSSVDFEVAAKINIMREGGGVTIIQAATGVTINGVLDGSVVINSQFQGCTLTQRSINTWIASGDIT